MDHASVQMVQRDLSRLQKHTLSIVKLSEPLTDPSSTDSSASKRSSNAISTNVHGDDDTINATIHGVDTEGDGNPSPSSLASDLEHYRALFKKLHFSYLEQVSKEKFLRAIVGDPPQVVEPAENAALEAEAAAAKAALNARKAEVATLAEQLEATGRELARRHERVRLQAAQLVELPGEIESLEAEIARLEEENKKAMEGAGGDGNDDGGTSTRPMLPLQPTRDALDARRTESAELDREIAALQQTLPGRARQIERLEGELRPLESQRAAAAQGAAEARARREQRQRQQQGGGGDGEGDGADNEQEDQIELRGRWYQGAKEILGQVV